MTAGHIVVLTGGIGGAKLVVGLSHILSPDRLTAIVNTGDDFTHLGLRISPDMDTLLYTLAGLADPEKGWGRAHESWNFMAALRAIGGEDWFALGDADLALHVERTHRLAAGETLSAVAARFAERLGVRIAMTPMSDQKVTTYVTTDEGEMDFQHYFVRRRCAPKVLALRFSGAQHAAMSNGARAALESSDLAAIIIAPSNPYLSIDPILAVSDMRQAIKDAGVPVVVVNPLPGGRAVKGPTAKIMAELDIDRSAAAIACHYKGLASAILLDHTDSPVELKHAFTDTIMLDLAGRIRVARAALALTGQ
jgi:LPPG:FO 2-phospho-L-lactate transferase